jgi:hypothetical protein
MHPGSRVLWGLSALPMILPILLSPKFGGEVCAHFHAVIIKHYSSIRNWQFGRPGQIIAVPLKLILLFTCLVFFGLGEFRLSIYGSCFLPWTLVQSLPGCLSYFLWDLHRMLFRCQIHLEIISIQIQLQIKGCKESACPPNCMKFYTVTLEVC